jgi:hypothetical protein
VSAKTLPNGVPVLRPIYLGDSVYGGKDDLGRVWVWLDNGEGPYSVICLEPETLQALKVYADSAV